MKKRLLKIKSPIKIFIITLLVNYLFIFHRKDRREIKAGHFVNDRRKYSPRLLFVSLYVWILYTITATVILIGLHNIKYSVFLFAVFVIPLFLIICNPLKLKRQNAG